MYTFLNESVSIVHDLHGGSFADFFSDFVGRPSGGTSAKQFNAKDKTTSSMAVFVVRHCCIFLQLGPPLYYIYT